MEPGSRSLLKAALSFEEGGEDRLTEVFAAVLEANLDFAATLFDQAGLPFGERLEVRTQHIPEPTCRLDLVAITRSGGRHVAELWSEHKTTSGFSHNQLERYTAVLAGTRRTGRVISVVATPANMPNPHPDRERFLWQDIAEMANGVGFAWGGPGWRSKAMQPDAPAKLRLLHEFIWYVEREGYAVVDPLEQDDISVFQATPRTLPRIQRLIQEAASKMETLTVDGEVETYDDGSWWWQLFEAPSASWPARLTELGWEVYTELTLATEAAWSSAHANDACFGAGVTVDKGLRDELGARDDWLARAAEAGFDAAPVDELLRLYRTKPLAEVIDSGETLGDQATALAQWAEQAIGDALNLDPGELPARPKRGRPRRGADPMEEEGV